MGKKKKRLDEVGAFQTHDFRRQVRALGSLYGLGMEKKNRRKGRPPRKGGASRRKEGR